MFGDQSPRLPVRLAIGSRDLLLTRQAANLWAERVRGHPMPYGGVQRDLARLASVISTSWATPGWFYYEIAEGEQEWVMVGEDIAMPIDCEVVVTVLVRGGVSGGERARRTRLHREHRQVVRVLARHADEPLAGDKQTRWRRDRRARRTYRIAD